MNFVAGLHLIGMGLQKSSTELHRDKLWKILKSESSQVKRQLVESYRLTEIQEGFFEAEGEYQLTVGEGDLLGLEIHCSFEVHMHTASSEVDHAMAERFAKQDLRFVLLPYARQFVTDMTGQMQIPPIILPLATATGQARPKKSRAVKGGRTD
jgi:hypothetical protein